MANEAEIMDKIIREQLKLTPRRANLAILTLVLIFKSLAWSFSVIFSRASKFSSSLKVGLRGFVNPLPGVPGTLMALFKGDFGVIGTVDPLFPI